MQNESNTPSMEGPVENPAGKQLKNDFSRDHMIRFGAYLLSRERREHIIATCGLHTENEIAERLDSVSEDEIEDFLKKFPDL